MRILSVDTSTAACSIVLSVDGRLEGEVNVESEQTHSSFTTRHRTLLRSCGVASRMSTYCRGLRSRIVYRCSYRPDGDQGLGGVSRQTNDSGYRLEAWVEVSEQEGIWFQ
jgi:hypothetical protein